MNAPSSGSDLRLPRTEVCPVDVWPQFFAGHTSICRLLDRNAPLHWNGSTAGLPLRDHGRRNAEFGRKFRCRASRLQVGLQVHRRNDSTS